MESPLVELEGEARPEDFEDVLTAAESLGFFASIYNHKKWTPSSDELLQASEARLLKSIRGKFQQRLVPIDAVNKINTLIMGQGPPMVLLHGFGGGIGAWIANLDDLAQHFTLYICDNLGFGRSSHPAYTGTTPEEGELFFMSFIKGWVDALSLNKFILVGHSMGGHLAALFAIKHPEYIEKLVLADPWGAAKMPQDPAQSRSFAFRAISTLSGLVKSPFSLLRAAGPIGLSLFTRIRPDLGLKFSNHVASPDHFNSYVYHCNVQPPSGDVAFTSMTLPGAWAAHPLVDRLHLLPVDMPVFFIYGKESWMDYTSIKRLADSLPHRFEIVLLPEAGHHVYIDNFIDFNRAICQAALQGTMIELIHELHDYQHFERGDRFVR